MLAIRAQRQIKPRSVGFPDNPGSDISEVNKTLRDEGPPNQVEKFNINVIGDLPHHLGWESNGVAKHIRASLQKNKQNNKFKADKGSWLKELSQSAPPTLERKSDLTNAAKKSNSHLAKERQLSALTDSVVASGSVKHYPDIGLGILRAKLAAPGRIWLLLRWIDRKGSGQIEVERARRLLCEPGSVIKVCGWRQLRSLLVRGDGIFWSRSKGRIWLRSIAKVGRSLKVERLSGHPVALPIKILLAGIGQVRAHLYASFHSGRKQANPISRKTLRKISKISVRSQQNYERRVNVRKQKNYAIGSKLQDERAKNSAWQFGSACFRWVDHQHAFKPQGTTRLAWQLPNSYHGPHARQPRGQQRSINRKLVGLSTKGMMGNGQFDDDGRLKRYFNTAAAAIRHLDQVNGNVYWSGEICGQWYVFDTPEASCK